VIYLDSSVALAHLLAEDRSPPESIWRETLVASRLLEYEVWNRIHARRLACSHGEAMRALIGHADSGPFRRRGRTQGGPATSGPAAEPPTGVDTPARPFWPINCVSRP
jgi:hypothetical protein